MSRFTGGTDVSGLRPKVAILGWGSLLWENADFDARHEEWQSDGPSLPLEFSRISSTRSGALTLVIDYAYGSLVTVAWCMSKRQYADDAVVDLRCREGCSIKDIRSLSIPLLQEGSGPPEASVIAEWASVRHIDVVVWTGLPSNFETKRDTPFSVEHAIRYLKTLPPEGKARAAEYIWRAPKFVDTPLRDALQTQPWFGPSCCPTGACS